MSAAEPNPARRFRRRDAAFLGLFLFYWLLPMAYHSLSQGKRMPGTPAWMFHLTNVSCLFTTATLAWPSEYVQVLPGNRQAWVEFPESEYSTMKVFGNRTRLTEIHRRGLDRQAYSDLALWLFQRYQAQHPGEPPPAALRLVRAYYFTGREEPRGHWSTPPLDTIPAAEQTVVFTYYPRPGAGDR